MKLNSRQIRYLRGLGHHLSPLVMIGREGVGKNLIGSVASNLAAHELIKVRVQNNCPLPRREAIAVLAEEAGAQVVQVIGRVGLLYRANDDLDQEKRILLPK